MYPLALLHGGLKVTELNKISFCISYILYTLNIPTLLISLFIVACRLLTYGATLPSYTSFSEFYQIFLLEITKCV